MRKIIDMAGRQVELPDVINRVYAPSPYGSTMLYSLAPEKLAGFMLPMSDKQLETVVPAVRSLPIIGKITEIEAIRSAAPDLILIWGDKSNPIHPKSEDAMKKLDIPHIYVTTGDLVDLNDYPDAYRFLGRILNVEERAEKLAEYCSEALKETEELLKRIPTDKRPKAYYAEGPLGLNTEFDSSLHAHLLRLAGDVNVHHGVLEGHAGMEPMTFDQILAYDPDVIFAQDKNFIENIVKNSADWRKISAVAENRAYLIPKLPFNWFDRPPCFMRIFGLKWVMKCLYPEYYNIDPAQEAKTFFELFTGAYDKNKLDLPF